jgi:7-carboxy-7-deazaguanine synthase
VEAATLARTRTRTFPVVEVFGPTVQGEGALAGRPTYFVRFGGCDYRCSWCDSMYAVEPALVRQAEKLGAQEIVGRLADLPAGPEWVTFSGGNPALMNFAGRANDLPEMLRRRRLKIAVETQGSIWHDWLGEAEHLTVSPKPPSSAMATAAHARRNEQFMEIARQWQARSRRSLKIVVFDEADYEWAADYFGRYPEWDHYLSVGTPPLGRWGDAVRKAVSEREAREQVAVRYAWLCERVAADPRMRAARVYPQLHVIAWGHARGV